MFLVRSIIGIERRDFRNNAANRTNEIYYILKNKLELIITSKSICMRLKYIDIFNHSKLYVIHKVSNKQTTNYEMFCTKNFFM